MSNFNELTPRTDVVNLEPYKTLSYDVSVKLDANESPYGIPAPILEKFEQRLSSIKLNRYPDPLSDEVRDLLAAKYGLVRDNFLVGNGGDELIYYLLLAYGGKGRKALSFPPTFSVYGIYSQITYTELKNVARNEKFEIDVRQLDEAVKYKPDIIFICNPNNPTGTELPTSVIDHLISLLPRALILIDEAYGEFSKLEHARYIDKGNILVLKTFSKAFSLAGARIGYVFGNKGIIDNLIKVKLPYNLNVVSQELAKLCLKNEEAFGDNIKALILGREYIMKALTEIPGVYPFPSGANYVLFKLEKPTDKVFQALLEKDILVRPFFGDNYINDCLRVTIGSPEENIKFVKALENIMEED